MTHKDPEKRREYAAAYHEEHKGRRRLQPLSDEERLRRHRARKAAQMRKRRAEDPVFRAKHVEYSRMYQKKLREQRDLEIVAEQYLHEQVEVLGGMCPKFVDPSRRGAPDRMVLLPGLPAIFVEMKRESLGRLKSWQERYHADLRALGNRVEVLWSKEDVDNFIASVHAARLSVGGSYVSSQPQPGHAGGGSGTRKDGYFALSAGYAEASRIELLPRTGPRTKARS